MRLYGLDRAGRLRLLASFRQSFWLFIQQGRASLGRNPNCSSRISPRLLTSDKILVRIIFSYHFQIVSNRLMGR